MTDRQIRELARRLAAAYISWSMGYKSVDHVLRKHIPKKLPAAWIAYAEETNRRMNPESNPSLSN